MKKLLLIVALAVAGTVAAGTIVDQGAPGTFGPWKVVGSGGTTFITSDGGFIGRVQTQPCSRIVQTNDAGVGTTASRVPVNGGTSGRLSIRICNSPLNTSSAICICSAQECPGAVAVGQVGDPLLTSDCVTYLLDVLDGGVPCCVCNGAGTFLPASECMP